MLKRAFVVLLLLLCSKMLIFVTFYITVILCLLFYGTKGEFRESYFLVYSTFAFFIRQNKSIMGMEAGMMGKVKVWCLMFESSLRYNTNKKHIYIVCWKRYAMFLNLAGWPLSLSNTSKKYKTLKAGIKSKQEEKRNYIYQLNWYLSSKARE